MFNADNVSDLPPMTSEERIAKAKEVYGYDYELNEKLQYFSHYGKHWHDYYEQAKKIYWYYQNLCKLSPSEDLPEYSEYVREYTYKNGIIVSAHQRKIKDDGTIKRYPQFKNIQEMELWCQFHKMMRHKYAIR